MIWTKHNYLNTPNTWKKLSLDFVEILQNLETILSSFS